MRWTQINAFALGAMLTLPATGQTLEQAISITLATNPELKSAFNEFVSKRYANEASSGAYLPRIDLDAGIGYESINPAEGESTDLTRKEASLTFTQLIWDGSSTLNDMDRTAAEAESLRYQLLADAQNKALEVTKVYLDSVKAYEILSLSESNLATHKRIYSDIPVIIEDA
ncbi:agglutination protein [Vibrio vulnificus]|nr:TolC family protein [Vibrio vulnificus]POC55315.1 agglutination protein [Vibrio vulnificus]POC63679.1 agglutination protein [Vibrio vulnificus]